MTEQQKLIAHFIETSEKRIIQLEALKLEFGHKFMVVCGDDFPLPINFDHASGWGNVETATKWNRIQFARANASKVVNGLDQVGKAVLIADHIEWDIAQQKKLIAQMQESVK
jgi:hypothetical protein